MLTNFDSIKEKRDARPVRHVDPRYIADMMKEDNGPKKVVAFIRNGLRSEKEGGQGLHPSSFRVRDLALAMGVMDPYNPEGSLQQNMALGRGTERYNVEQLLTVTESNPGVGTNAFQVATGELIMDQVIRGYEDDSDFIGDQLVEVMPGQRMRNQKMVGFTSLAGPTEVKEGRPYEESGFTEKYVTTKESKKGRILSINEELILFDQTSEIFRRGREIGFYVRQERERVIVRGVIDADASTDPVYRPSGTGVTLYNTDGSLYNWIGVGNTTSTAFNAAVQLQDWTDLEFIMRYRATQVKDDRIDGTQRHIAGLNGPENVLLVPWALRGTANYISNATTVVVPIGSTSSVPAGVSQSEMGNPFQGQPVAASGFIDEVGGQALNDYFFGNFRRQFKWTEIWPIQTFTQGSESEAQFERDVAFRIKVRYYGGLSAIDTIWVTKIDGA